MTNFDPWDRLRALFAQAVDLDPARREEFLGRCCDGDADLRSRLEALLAAHDGAGLATEGAAPAPSPPIGATSDALVGVTIGDYRVLDPIGEGGMGRVYRAFDLRLERYVALKMLPDEFARDEARSARFRREARVLASVSHANIAPIYDVQEHQGRLVLVLELVEGHTLAHHIRAGPIGLDEAVTIARQISEALAAAHSAGVIHRDLKPANIAIAADGAVKVLDFGIAKARSLRPRPEGSTPTEELAATTPGLRLGTPSYMSPEQIRGLHVDERTDVWAFGVVLFEMLAGVRPFGAGDHAVTLARILERSPDWGALPRSTPEPLRRLLERCLEKDPRRRLQAIGEARLVLESTQEQRAEEVRRRVGARRRLVAVAPYVALGVVIFFALTRPWASPDAADDTNRIVSPRQASFTGDVYEAVIGPVGPLVATARQVGDEQVVTVHDLTGSAPVDVARGPRICCLSWSPDGARLAFQRREEGGRSVAVVPARGGLERSLVPDAPWLRGARWSPDGTRVASWADNLDIVQVIDLDSGRTTWYAPDGVTDGIRWMLDVDWGPSGQFALVSMSDDGQYQIHVMESDGEAEGSVEHPRGGTAERVSVDSRLLLSDDRTIHGVRWESSGEALYYLGAGAQYADLYRIDVTSGASERVGAGLQVLADVDGDLNVALSRDGVLSFAGGQRYSNLWHIPFDSSVAPHALTDGTMQIRRPDVSPDGRRVAFEAATAAGFDIFTVDLEDGSVRQVTQTVSGAVSPAWSPSGDSIAYVLAGPDAHQVWTVVADGTEATILEEGPVSDVLWRVLEWAPGMDLLFQDPTLQFTRLRAQGGQEPLTAYDGPGGNFVLDARYAPDGRSVAILWNQANQMGLWVVPDGGEARRLLAGQYMPVGWSGDGATVYAFDFGRRRVVAVDPTNGTARHLVSLPPGVDPINLAVAPDGRGLIAAVEEAPGDAMLLDLGGAR